MRGYIKEGRILWYHIYKGHTTKRGVCFECFEYQLKLVRNLDYIFCLIWLNGWFSFLTTAALPIIWSDSQYCCFPRAQWDPHSLVKSYRVIQSLTWGRSLIAPSMSKVPLCFHQSVNAVFLMAFRDSLSLSGHDVLYELLNCFAFLGWRWDWPTPSRSQSRWEVLAASRLCNQTLFSCPSA